MREIKPIQISSPAFEDSGDIPVKYTCDGENINPPLYIKNIPADTVCLALIIDDPDAPIGTWTHWLVWNIPFRHHLKERHNPGTQGINDFGRTAYRGPCPPDGTHCYHIRVYALNSKLDIPPGASRQLMETAMSGHILATGSLTGYYTRKIMQE